jgi:hypothetical protein
VTVTELAHIFRVSTATARRWTTGAGLPHRAGHPGNPWEADAIPVDDSLGVRQRRIVVADIKASALSTEQQQLLFELTCRWPDGWSRSDAAAPLVLPPGLEALSGAEDDAQAA